MAPLAWMMKWSARHTKDEVESHLLMSGGKLFVPNAEIASFYEAYARSVLRNEPNSLCEKRSNERLRLCVDVDIYMRAACSSAFMVDILNVVGGVCRDFFSESERCLDILVLACEPHPDEKNGQACVKTGIHLVWEALTVELRTANIFRNALVQKLELSSLDVPIGGWGVAIDSAICKHGILRMLYAHKYSDCPSCRNKKAIKTTCASCLTVGKIDIKRAYTLKAVWRQPTGKLEPVLAPTTVTGIADHLARASIRTEDPAVSLNAVPPNWFENAMFLPLDLSGGTQNKGLTRKDKTRRATLLVEGHSSVDGMLQKEPIGGDLLKHIERYIRRVSSTGFLHAAYTDVSITNAFYALNRDLIIAKADSSFCMNTHNEHKSNTIYFEIKRSAAECRQRCFCRCDTKIGRRQGVCARFQSHPVLLLQKDFTKFFPAGAATPTEAAAAEALDENCPPLQPAAAEAPPAVARAQSLLTTACNALQKSKRARVGIEAFLAGRKLSQPSVETTE